MGAPSSQQEAKERAAEQERQPRTRKVNDRLQQLLAEMDPFSPDPAVRKQRIRYESLSLAVQLDGGPDMSEREFSEWRELLGGMD